MARVLSPVTSVAEPGSRLPGGATTPTEVSPGAGQTAVTEATGTFSNPGAGVATACG